MKLFRVLMFLSIFCNYMSQAFFTENTHKKIYPITKNKLYHLYTKATENFNISSVYKRDLPYMWENVVRSALNGIRYYETTITYPLLLEDSRFLQQFYSYFPDCRVIIGDTHLGEKNPHLVSIRIEWTPHKS